jgi:hypothetical protein
VSVIDSARCGNLLLQIHNGTDHISDEVFKILKDRLMNGKLLMLYNSEY